MPIKTSQYGGSFKRGRKRKIERRAKLGLSPDASDQEVRAVERENKLAEKELEEKEKKEMTRGEKLSILTGAALYQRQILLSVSKLNHPRLSPRYSEILDNDVLDKIGRTVQSKMIQFPWKQSSSPQPLSDLHSMTDTDINNLLKEYNLDQSRARIIKRNDFFHARPDLKNNYSDLYNKIKEGINTKLKIEIINKVRTEDLLLADNVDNRVVSELYSSMELKTGFEDAHESQLMAVRCVAPLEVNFDDPRFIIDLIDMFSEGWDYLMSKVVQYEKEIAETGIDIYEKLFVDDSRTLWNEFDEVGGWHWGSRARTLAVQKRVGKFILHQTLKEELERAILPLLETKIDVLKKKKLGLDPQATSEELVEKEREYMELLRAEKEAQRNRERAEREREREMERERRDRERTEEEATKDPWWAAFYPFSLDGVGQGGGRKTKNKNKSRRRKTKKRKTKKLKSRRKTRRIY